MRAGNAPTRGSVVGLKRRLDGDRVAADENPLPA
jgi:hypothetical protein